MLSCSIVDIGPAFREGMFQLRSYRNDLVLQVVAKILFGTEDEDIASLLKQPSTEEIEAIGLELGE